MLKRLRAFGTYIKVRFEPFSSSEEDYGQYLIAENLIRINTADTSKPVQVATLMHEIMEVINDRLELSLPHEQISQMESAWTQILLDNPNLLKLLQKASKDKG